MQLGRTHLNHSESERRRLCFYCGSEEHKRNACTERNFRRTHKNKSPLQKSSRVSKDFPTSQTIYPPSSYSTVKPSFLSPSADDSGADESFLDWDTANTLNIKMVKVNNPWRISVVISPMHQEEISFLITTYPKQPILEIFGSDNTTQSPAGILMNTQKGPVSVRNTVWWHPTSI